MTRNGIVHLDCYRTKILPLLGGFVRFDFYPLGLLSYGAFVHWGFSLCAHVMLIVHTWCDRDHMTRNLIVHLDCWRTKILPLLGILSALIFILWGFCPIVLLSILLFSVRPRDVDCPQMLWSWSHDQKCDCTPWLLARQNIASFAHFVRFHFFPLWLLFYGVFVHWGFSLCAHVMLIVLTCCDRDHMTRNGIVHLDCWRTKILPLLLVLSALIFILWGFCPMVLLSIGDFLCAPTWCWLSTPGVIVITWPEMGLYTLIVGVLKYCLFWGFCPLWFL